jgi:hypothetical protein
MTFCVLLLYLWLMGCVHKADWIVTFLIMTAFTVPISIVEASDKLLHSVLLIASAFSHVGLLPSLCMSPRMHGLH